VAKIFNKLADLLEIEEANPFRVRAYRSAARTLASLPRHVSEMSEKELTGLPGIGKDLAAKIREIVEKGSLSQLQALEEKTPPELNDVMKVAGLGPKRVRTLYKELGIADLNALKGAAESHRIRELEGFGEKLEESILEELQHIRERGKRIKLVEAEQRANPLVAYLEKTDGVKAVTVAGSFRRRLETVGDLDILATCTKGSPVMDRFVGYEDVDKVVSRGETRSTVLLRSGLQVDLRVLPEASYGAALHYFTGSKAHNIAVRKLGVKKKLKINEYGVFRGGKRIAGKTEGEVYGQIDLPYIEPELREDRGELEAAREGKLPSLVRIEEIRGDLHAHTDRTDGHATLEEMAEAARARGYEYLAVTDHSKKVAMAHGLDAGGLRRQMEEIDRINDRLKDVVLLKGIEVDILKDGSLDLPDDVLKDLDLTVCSIHYNRNLSEKEQSERVIRAMDNPYFSILAHPTGRLINEREPYGIDLEEILEAARERGCFVEINAHPDRLDLSDRYCRLAKEMGVMLAVSTDAHRTADLAYMRYGVDQARRGWLEPDDVINSRSLKELRKLLKRK